MGRVQHVRLFSGLAVSVVAGGCTLTPAPETPALVNDLGTNEQFTQSELTASGLPETQGWWLAIGGEELDGLITALRSDSLILQEARLQAEQAREGVNLARSQRLPSVSAISEVSTSRSPDVFGDFAWSEDYTAGLLADLNTDVFGGLRASQRSAELTAIATDLSVQSTEQREIAILARNWVSAITLQRRLELANRTAESFRSTYELTDQRYSAGSSSVTASDVQIALQNLETALVDIPDLETELAVQFLVIDEQLARLPGQTARTFVGSFAPYEPFTAPVGTPARLLASRPDVAAAELRYLAALEDVGASRASLYPAMSLSASLTFQGDTLGDVFDWDRHIASLANSLTAPIFQGGRLRSQVRLDEARAQELATTFARTALEAIVDVEIALAELAGLEEQRIQLVAAFETATLSNELSQGRYRQGLSSILSVLETQRSLNNAEQNLLLTDQALANARIDLFLSLGGNWTDGSLVSEGAETS